MSLLCHLLGHVPALAIQHNQGFAFSRCLRCCHDMIRSEETVPHCDWKRVPIGFRVKRSGDSGRTPQQIAQARQAGSRSGTGDLLRIGAATMFWETGDAIRARPRRHARTLRLTVS